MAIILRPASGNRAAANAKLQAIAPTGQRIRIGLTMLAAIFLVVLVAAAGMRPHRSVAPADSAGEPLANMGLAPGAGHLDAPAKVPVPARPAQVALVPPASPAAAPARR